MRRYSSADPTGPTQEQLNQSTSIPDYWIRRHKVLPATAGMHRWVWDLHYAAPVSIQRQYPISAVPHDTPHLPLGPTALPGPYTVRLIAAGQTKSENLIVKMDPRVKTPLAGLESQFQAEQGLASMIARSSEVVGLARSLQAQVGKLTGDKEPPISTHAKALEKTVTTLLDGPAPGPKGSEQTGLASINEQVSSLYGQVMGADAAPTASQAAAVVRLGNALLEALTVWGKVQETDLPAFNARLHASGLAEIHPEWNPATQPDSENEE